MKKIIVSLSLFLSINANCFAGNNFNKVLYIVFENVEFSRTITQPYFNQLKNDGALLTNFNAAIHPSQGNYVAMVAGSTYNVNHDNVILLNERHLGDLLEEAKKDWRLYAEDYPGNCFKGKTSQLYAQKHIPFMLFSNVQTNPARCSKIVNSSQFFTDLQNNNLKEFSMYVPNLKNDGHNTGVAFADVWFKNTFDKILHSPTFPKDLLVVVTFDEGTTPINHIYTLLMGANVKPRITSDKAYNFYSLLRTIEDELGLGSLNKNDMTALKIEDVWK
jgi:acid phosphatase